MRADDPFDAVFRFRCDKAFKQPLKAVAKLERRESSDLARIVLDDYVKAHSAAKIVYTIPSRATAPSLNESNPGANSPEAGTAERVSEVPIFPPASPAIQSKLPPNSPIVQGAHVPLNYYKPAAKKKRPPKR